MATLNELIQQSIERLSTVPDAFVSDADKIQKAMLKDVVDIMGRLQTENGQFIYNEYNLNLLNSINKSLTNSIFNDEYTSSLTSYLQEFNTQADINNNIFAKTVDGFETKDIYETTLRSTQQSTLELFGQDAFATNIVSPIKNQLSQAVMGGATFGDTVKAVEVFITGDPKLEITGVLKGYIKTNSYDAFAIANRTYTNAVTNDLQVKWFNYKGGVRDTTRCFCENRNGKTWHVEEIKAWGRGEDLGECNIGDGKWAGQRKGTNETTIFSFLGGYNCDHSLIAVSENRVDKSTIERVRNKGYI